MSSCLSEKGEYFPTKDMLSNIGVPLHGIPFPLFGHQVEGYWCVLTLKYAEELGNFPRGDFLWVV